MDSATAYPFARGGAVLIGGILAMLGGLFINIRQFQFDEFTNSVQALEASISSVVFIGAAMLFLVSLGKPNQAQPCPQGHSRIARTGAYRRYAPTREGSGNHLAGRIRWHDAKAPDDGL